MQEEKEVIPDNITVEEMDGMVITVAGSATPVTKAQVKTFGTFCLIK